MNKKKHTCNDVKDPNDCKYHLGIELGMISLPPVEMGVGRVGIINFRNFMLVSG